MFIEASAPVPLPVARAREALLPALASADLLEPSAVTYGAGVSALYDVGPRGASKRVRARVLPSTDIGALSVVPIRWEATGVGSHLFPTLEASLTVLPANEVTCVLSLVGRYVVPLGRVGQLLDRAALASVAQRTLDLFVSALAKRIATQAQAGAASA